MKNIALLLFLSCLTGLSAVIDYRALNTNDFYTNGYYVSLKPVAGTNVQILPGTGLTFTTNGRVVTITATGTNQVTITNVVLQAGTNIVVETNGPTSWTISGQPGLWLTNAADGSITNINTGSGTAYVGGTNGLLVLNNAASGKNILLTGETNGTPSFRLRSDGSMFLGKHVTNDVNVADFTTTYPLYFNGYTLSNDPVLASFKIGNQDQNGIPTFFSVISGGVLANKDTGSAIWTAQASTTNGLSRTWQIRAKPSLSQLAFATETNTAFKVDDKGDISIIKSIPYLWPLTNGGANQFLTTDGGNPQQLSWTPVATGAGSNSVAVAAGTNIFLVTNTGLVTINVANTNLPVVVAGTNVTVVTNGIEYTVSSTAVGGGGGAVGPGTINQVAKFVATTNVGDSIVAETATNMWQWKSRVAPNAYTNHITNEMVGQWTNPTNWTALDLVSAGPANEFNELHAVHGSSYTTGDWPLKLMDTWSIESPTPTGGHSAGELFPAADDTYIIGDSSHQVKNVYVGTGGIDIGIAATKPALRFHNNFVSTWYGVDGTGSSLAFYRDTGITAAFDRFNNLFVFDVAGNYIGFGSSGVSNCTAFLSTGEAVTNGLVQVGTNSAVASPVPAGIMASRGSGTDKGGADLVVAGGVSTGTGTSGKILFATSGSAAGSSPTLNGLTNRMEIDPGSGNVIIYSNLTVNGSFSAGSISDPNALTNNDTRNITFNGTFTDTQNGVSTTIASNTITSGMLTLSGSGTNYFGANVNVSGTVNATGYTNSGLTASRLMLTDANKAQASAAASGAVPVDADGSATTFSQVNALAQGNIVTNQSSTLTFTNVTLYGTSGGTNWTFTDGAGWHNTNSGAASQGVTISKGDIYATKTITATNGFSSRSNVFTLMPTNTPTDGQVMTATGTAGDTAWKTASGGSLPSTGIITPNASMIANGYGTASAKWSHNISDLRWQLEYATGGGTTLSGIGESGTTSLQGGPNSGGQVTVNRTGTVGYYLQLYTGASYSSYSGTSQSSGTGILLTSNLYISIWAGFTNASNIRAIAGASSMLNYEYTNEANSSRISCLVKVSTNNANFQFLTCNGSTENISATTVPVDTAFHRFEMFDCDGTGTNFCLAIDGTRYVTNSISGVPSAGMATIYGVESLEAAAKAINIKRAYFEYNQ